MRRRMALLHLPSPSSSTGACAHLLGAYSCSHLLLRMLCRQSRRCKVIMCGHAPAA